MDSSKQGEKEIVQKKQSIGQFKAAVDLNCPKEALNWTTRIKKIGEVSFRNNRTVKYNEVHVDTEQEFNAFPVHSKKF
ncbi:hypothetical protein [Ureibacillus sinduriensis]|uniref:Uncharacterized protein n=1 Tax=Ureibacillus sinduriensis BLB-1 = JCM 15800 TaxID=1384057 RepID=A0A0A3HNB5_9BACL|nr:hypothetical protein [Ureibacillus sinduriensis]KGR74066.1 hypothetical protein CD33_18900 [Ureibacillus sinduriensis BLB-1 = JCM 15800]